MVPATGFEPAMELPQRITNPFHSTSSGKPAWLRASGSYPEISYSDGYISCSHKIKIGGITSHRDQYNVGYSLGFITFPIETCMVFIPLLYRAHTLNLME